MAELLMGDEAVGLAAIDAGIRGAFSYPGTPATEIFECIRSRAGEAVAARWSANEKIAYEEALGMSYVGGRALVSMKHVGLNVAADPFMSSALTGTVGGLVCAVADDPGMHSSQNEQDTRFYADFARVPLFEPSNQQEAYDMTREAFELSEELGIPVVIRLVTRLAHSRAAVERKPPSDRKPLDQRGDANNWILLPPNARRRNRRLIDMQDVFGRRSEESPHNEIVLRGGTGIIACGLGYNYVKEAIGDQSEFSILKISAYPVPTRLVREIVDHCNQIVVVEEGYPLIEARLRGLLGVPSKTIRGRMDGALPPDGELSATLVRGALGLHVALPVGAIEDLPARPPSLCQGCPHCDTFRMINDALSPGVVPLLFGDIGCYTLGAMPPYNAVDTCVEMGASVGMALGAAKAGAHPILCTIGDSTFAHSGMGTILAAAKENANMTVVILDNAGVAMTGGQDVFVTGEDFIRLLRGLGVDARHIVQIDPVKKDHARNVELLREEIDYRGLSVVIATRPCIHLKRRAHEEHSAVGCASSSCVRPPQPGVERIGPRRETASQCRAQ